MRDLAIKLVKYYSRLASDPVSGKLWELGLNTAQEWLYLIDNQGQPDLAVQVKNLLTKLESSDQGSAWYEMYVYVKKWDKELSGADM
jgi:hypothetical protein